MSDPLIHSCDDYLVLEPGEKEKFLSSDQTLKWLEKWLKKFDELPKDLKDEPSLKDAARRLLDTACDLEIKPGFNLQWFAIRLEPPDS
tara:strand:- start:288 stop:551 length:264 start_codon:yes stop_codon:yes gene_type:complete